MCAKDTFFQKIYNFLSDSDDFKNVTPNIESCHITIINSNIVAEIGENDVKEILTNFKQDFLIETGKIKSTFSEDYSFFSTCYVVEIQSLYINEFLNTFNLHFQTSLFILKTY